MQRTDNFVSILSADCRDRERRSGRGLRGLPLDGSIFLRAAFAAPWAYESPPRDRVARMLKAEGQCVFLFHIFTEGTCRVRTGNGPAEEFTAGDIVIFPGAERHRVGHPTVDGALPRPGDLAGRVAQPLISRKGRGHGPS